MTDSDEPKNPLKLAEEMKDKLTSLESPETRREITEYLKDQFISKRLSVSSKQEELREAVLNSLLRKVEDTTIPVVTLLKMLESLNTGAEIDISSSVGRKISHSKDGQSSGVNVQINNTLPSPATSGNSESSSPVKDLGFVFKTMKTISDNMPVDKAKEMKQIIDVKKSDDDK